MNELNELTLQNGVTKLGVAALRLERLGGLWSGRSALELTISLTGVFLSIELERSTLLKQQINRYVMI